MFGSDSDIDDYDDDDDGYYYYGSDDEEYYDDEDDEDMDFYRCVLYLTSSNHLTSLSALGICSKNS